jgi:hypothetical protein
MSRAALSIFVYGCYLVILSLTLFLIPNIALQIVGLDAHKEGCLDLRRRDVCPFSGGLLYCSSA